MWMVGKPLEFMASSFVYFLEQKMFFFNGTDFKDTKQLIRKSSHYKRFHWSLNSLYSSEFVEEVSPFWRYCPEQEKTILLTLEGAFWSYNDIHLFLAIKKKQKIIVRNGRQITWFNEQKKNVRDDDNEKYEQNITRKCPSNILIW